MRCVTRVPPVTTKAEYTGPPGLLVAAGSRYVAGDAEPLACPRSFRQVRARRRDRRLPVVRSDGVFVRPAVPRTAAALRRRYRRGRSEEHTSELQSRENLVCRLLLEKKK